MHVEVRTRYSGRRRTAAHLALLAIGGMVALSAGRAGTAAGAGEPLLFPPGQGRARIKYLNSISDSRDFVKRSWWKKVVGTITGGEEVKKIVRPYGIEVNERGWVYVCDPGEGVVHCFKGVHKGYMTLPTKGRMESPIDVAIDDDGNVYVTDSKAGEVFCYSPRGDLVRRFGSGLERPAGIAFHRGRETLYVVDTAGQKVVIFDKSGRITGTFGSRGEGDGEFNFPTNIFIDSEGMVYVTDSMNFRVQVFDGDGRFAWKFGKLGDGTGDFSRPKGVAVDSDGNVYVVDALFDAVQIFDTQGRLLLSFGRPGHEPAQFWLPSGITIDGRNMIYVADSYNGRVQVFQYLGDEQ